MGGDRLKRQHLKTLLDSLTQAKQSSVSLSIMLELRKPDLSLEMIGLAQAIEDMLSGLAILKQEL